ncbi:ABC transporter substrate-binding protein [Nitratireductor kimnyeongensis]|uniref:ABC transporter substrate-binding protein n=1 Tax=Nitratireductor kimnyeongensis TaxID=430679 RepID=A0ABW0TE96_9HYPH|nr:ABC transporter substrate-binding protein [Nitratireductor kimnyeongensis]QZZ36935.1 ABC transporter substrate-binding protein [Nitratireductor kimnyeongensis]
MNAKLNGLKTLTSVLALSLTGMVATPVATAEAQSGLSGEARYSWWGGPSRNEKTYDVIELFESENPGVSIVREPSDWSGYWQKVNVQAAGSNLPCIIQMQNRWLANYDDPSILLPLDDLVASGKLDLTGIPKPLIDSGRGEDGKLYMVPTGVFFYVMLMNQSLAESTGITPFDSDSVTWEEFKTWLLAVNEKLPDGVDAAGGMPVSPEAFIAYVQSHGQKVFSEGGVGFDEAIVTDWFNYWEELRKAGAAQDADRLVEERSDLIEESGIANGRLVVQPRPANRLDAHQAVLDTAAPGSNLDIALYPLGPDGAGEDVGINGISIAAGCEAGARDIAVAYTNFFLQDERAANIYSSDNGVVAVDRFQEAQYKMPDATDGQKEQIEALRVVSKRAKGVFYPTGAYQALKDSLQSAYERVAFGRSTPEEAAANMINEINRNMK